MGQLRFSGSRLYTPEENGIEPELPKWLKADQSTNYYRFVTVNFECSCNFSYKQTFFYPFSAKRNDYNITLPGEIVPSVLEENRNRTRN